MAEPKALHGARNGHILRLDTPARGIEADDTGSAADYSQAEHLSTR